MTQHHIYPDNGCPSVKTPMVATNTSPTGKKTLPASHGVLTMTPLNINPDSGCPLVETPMVARDL